MNSSGDGGNGDSGGGGGGGGCVGVGGGDVEWWLRVSVDVRGGGTVHVWVGCWYVCVRGILVWWREQYGGVGVREEVSPETTVKEKDGRVVMARGRNF